MKYALFVTDV